MFFLLAFFNEFLLLNNFLFERDFLSFVARLERSQGFLLGPTGLEGLDQILDSGKIFRRFPGEILWSIPIEPLDLILD